MTDELALYALALNFSLCGININTPGLYFTSMYIYLDIFICSNIFSVFHFVLNTPL